MASSPPQEELTGIPEPFSESNSLTVLVARCYLGGVQKPTYPLSAIKGLVKEGEWVLTGSAAETVVDLELGDDDVADCIVNYLQETHFHKTMESEKKSGLMQDVYYITYQDRRLYVKLQINGKAVVVSFKEAD